MDEAKSPSSKARFKEGDYALVDLKHMYVEHPSELALVKVNSIKSNGNWVCVFVMREDLPDSKLALDTWSISSAGTLWGFKESLLISLEGITEFEKIMYGLYGKAQ